MRHCSCQDMRVVCAVPHGPKTLDFAGAANILNVLGNGTLSIKDLNVRGIASRHLLGAAYVPDLRAVDFPFWPTVTMQPDAKVSPSLSSAMAYSLQKEPPHDKNKSASMSTQHKAA